MAKNAGVFSALSSEKFAADHESTPSEKSGPPVSNQSVPLYPPPAMILRGHVADHSVSVPLWSYTVAINAINMYDKAGQKLKGSVALDLFATGGSWEEANWVTLKTSRSSGHRK